MTKPGAPFTKVQFLEAAADDVRAIAATNRNVAVEVFRLLRELDVGRLVPVPLKDFAKTGDLSDCGKIVVALEGEPEHRIVVRAIGRGFEITEVVVVEDRTQDLPYLLAALRLGRLDDPIRKSDALKRVGRVRKLLGRD